MTSSCERTYLPLIRDASRTPSEAAMEERTAFPKPGTYFRKKRAFSSAFFRPSTSPRVTSSGTDISACTQLALTMAELLPGSTVKTPLPRSPTTSPFRRASASSARISSLVTRRALSPSTPSMRKTMVAAWSLPPSPPETMDAGSASRERRPPPEASTARRGVIEHRVPDSVLTTSTERRRRSEKSAPMTHEENNSCTS